jgi:hypothetical protein
MRSLRGVMLGGGALCILLSGCGGAGLPGVPIAPTERLETRELLVWHTLRRVLTLEGVRGAGIGAVCVGMGAEGGGVPPVSVLRDFSGLTPPVVSWEVCSRDLDSGAVFESGSGAPASFLSFLDVNDAPGAMTARVRIEVPGQEPEVRTCRLEFVGVVVRMRPGERPPPMPQSSPPPARVTGC